MSHKRILISFNQKRLIGLGLSLIMMMSSLNLTFAGEPNNSDEIHIANDYVVSGEAAAADGEIASDAEVLSTYSASSIYVEYSDTYVEYSDTIVGGSITFDTSRGTVTNCDISVTSAVIPSKINGVSVTSIGKFAFYNCSSLTSIEIPSSVTSIGESAFYNCSSLTSIETPSSVTSIGESAFDRCDNLTHINVDNSNKNYTSLDGVLFDKKANNLIRYPQGKTNKEYIIPNTVTSIEQNAFELCKNLTDLTISKGVISIGRGAFGECYNLTNVIIPDSVTSIGIGAFEGCNINSISLPNSITTIGSYAFSSCHNLKNITLPNNITAIEECTFAICDSLTDVIIPNGVTTIGESAFGWCGNLTSVTLPDSLTSIGTDAFVCCYNLSNITLPNNLKSIGLGAFGMCDSLNSIVIPKSVKTIDESAFHICSSLTAINVDDLNNDYKSIDGVLYSKNADVLIKYPDNKSGSAYIIPNTVKNIDGYAFSHCSNLTSVTIPNCVTSIGNLSFHYCENLENITIPSSVTSIGNGAFSSCSNLTSITIPSSVTSIGESAFDECDKLTIHCMPDSHAETYAKENNIPYVYIDDECVTLSSNTLTLQNDGISSSLSATVLKDGVAVTEPSLTWTSSNPQVATVNKINLTSNSEAVVTPVGIGTCTITVATDTGASASCLVTVVETLQDNRIISLENDNYKILVGKTLIIIPNVSDNGNAIDDKSDVKWISSDSSIATVSKTDNGTGIVTALREGTVTITGELSNGQNANCKIVIYKGFTVNKDGWSFANGYEGFDYSDDYKIPEERYEEVFGKSYVSAAKANDNTYNSMIYDSWGGNCFGMSATSILFYLDELNWNNYNSLYEEDFSCVNNYFDSLQWKNLLYKEGYSSSGQNTEITNLIERYQIIQNSAIDYRSGEANNYSSYSDLYDEFMVLTESGNDHNYNHITSRKYINNILEKIKNSDKPLCIDLQYNEGAHAIVSRNDKAPVDEGNGWWKVYVYDPNTPYLDKSIISEYTTNLRSYYYNYLLYNNDDRYIELNPTENKWRYFGSINQGTRSDNHGCDVNGNVIYINKTVEKDGINYTETYPEFIRLIDLSTLPTVINGTEPFISENVYYIYITDESKFNLYSKDGELLTLVDNGNTILLDSKIEYNLFVEDEFQNCSKGILIVPKEQYTIKYFEGDDISLLGDDNVINIQSDGNCDIDVDLSKNNINIYSKDTNHILIQESNIFNNNSITSVVLNGSLLKDDKLFISLDDSNNIKTSLDTESDYKISVYVDNGSGEKYLNELSNIKKEILANTDGIISEIITVSGTETSTESTTTTEAATVTTTTARRSSNGGGGGSSSRKASTATESSTKVAVEGSGEETTQSAISSNVKVTIGIKKVVIGDKTYDMDVAPYIQPSSNSTLVPLRFVALAISGKDVEKADTSSNVKWDGATKTATVTVNNRVIKFTAGNNIMTVDGKSMVMENGVKAEISNGRMFIPFRALGKALGVNVEWDAETKTAIYK